MNLKVKFRRIIRGIEYFIVYLFFEMPQGVDFSIRAKNIYVKNKQFNGYARTSKKSISHIFKYVNIKGKKFLDIGSGKGAVLFEVYKLGANLAHGVEYDQKLHQRAIKNFENLNVNTLVKSFNLDAREFQNYLDYNVYFLFNPFNNEIYNQVIWVINNQIKNDTNERWLIAYGASNKEAILSLHNCILWKESRCPYRLTDFSIYKIN